MLSDLTCEICRKQLKTARNLEKHYQNLHGKEDQEIFCDFCGKVFNGSSRKSDLSSHIDIHRKFTILQCRVCRKNFTTTRILKDHLKGHFRPKVCEFCGVSFARIIELNFHIDAKHIQQVKHKCLICPRVFSTKKIARDHFSKVHRRKDEIFKCRDCSESFPSRESLRIHSFEHFTGDVFSCLEDSCGKFFKSKTSLKLHLRSHSDEKPFSCQKCGKRFVQSSGLGKHMKGCKCNGTDEKKAKKAMDPTEIVRIAKEQYEDILKAKGKLRKNLERKLRKCRKIDGNKKKINEQIDKEDGNFDGVNETDCFERDSDNGSEELRVEEDQERNFKEVESREAENTGHRSEKTHQETTGKECTNLLHQFFCDFCPSTFTSKSKLLLHLNRKHFESTLNSNSSIKIQAFSCLSCQKTFSSLTILHHHEKMCQNSTRLECGVCWKKLKNQACLRMHLKLHNNNFERKKLDLLPCPKCSKSFEGKGKLDRHIVNVHDKMSNGKEYRCGKCAACFTRNSDLREHSFLHATVNDIFSCLICGQRFYTKAKLKFHNFSHNPMTIECQVCCKTFARVTALRKHLLTCHSVRNDKVS